MTAGEIARARMRNIRLWGVPLDTPAHVVGWLCAMQSQEFGPAKWSIGERATGLTDAVIDSAFNDGIILRTHVLRPTWHFVLPHDIRWMLELTGPRVHRQMASYDRKFELDAAVLRKARRLIAKALERDDSLTKKEVGGVLERGGITASGQRLGLIVMSLELDAVICSGPLRGKQHTYALLDARAPKAVIMSRDEGLAELILRYFTGHGPATAKDLRWWASLTLAEIKRGLSMTGSQLEQDTVDGVTYWFGRDEIAQREPAPRAHLLQSYDEYIIGYSETRYLLDQSGLARSSFPDVFGGVVLVDGQVVGTYKRAPSKCAPVIEVSLLLPQNKSQRKAIGDGAARVGEFLGFRSELVMV